MMSSDRIVLGYMLVAVPPGKIFGGERFLLDYASYFKSNSQKFCIKDIKIFAPDTDRPFTFPDAIRKFRGVTFSEVNYMGSSLDTYFFDFSKSLYYILKMFEKYIYPPGYVRELVTHSPRVLGTKFQELYALLIKKSLPLKFENTTNIKALLVIDKFISPSTSRFLLKVMTSGSFDIKDYTLHFSEEVKEELKSVDLLHLMPPFIQVSFSSVRKISKTYKIPLVLNTFAHLSHGFFLPLIRSLKKAIDNSLISGILSFTNTEIQAIKTILGLFGKKTLKKFENVKKDAIPPPLQVSSIIKFEKRYKSEILLEAEKIRDGYDFVILSSTLHRSKGVLDTAKAVANIAKQSRLNILMVTFGRRMPHELDAWNTLIKKLKTEAKRFDAMYLGYVSEVKKAALFHACDVFSMPSIEDSFGIVYGEAWLRGKPVIGSSSNPVMFEVLDNGRRGLLVPFGDVKKLSNAIEALITDRQLAQKIGNTGRQYCYKELDISKNALKLWKFYQNVIS
ncbi:MAG: glycosyltransferase [Candidatus Marinimicrobia bacterium]|nr:glycosyltransferase [Candidatus Neomarinimicrobiota bacterium]